MQKVAIVTGAARGIGLATVKRFLADDWRKITCYQFLNGQLTDSNTLGIWLNGYVNGARGKTLIDPLSASAGT